MNTLVIYISHVLNDAIIDQYNYLKCACESFEYDIIWCSPNNHLSHDKIDIVNLDIPDEIIYDKISNAIAGHLYITPIYDLYPDYEYYWFIENDVIINNDNQIEGWKNLFNFYNDNISDLICSKINKYTDSYKYQLRYPFYKLQKYLKNPLSNINIEFIYFGFFPVCRISNKLLNNIKQYYNNNDGYLEWVIPSLAKYYNYTIESLSTDKFDIDESNNSDNNDNSWEINRGSVSWKLKEDKSYKMDYPINTIIHPIKMY